ncbi:MAG TPA: GNAT family N-acetyltransferase [Vicinamibacteria bacterium]|nr:GNAT family N-acetyltransferase [Vicinamibacteria bacterium]
MQVLRTYLEMRAPGELSPAPPPDMQARVERVEDCPPSFFRYLYGAVGAPYHWVDRLPWTDEDIRRYLVTPGVSLWVLSLAGAPAGYFELKSHDDGAVEIAYFGLLPEFIGRGLGKYMLTEAVREAWRQGARRVWLHTCTLDGAAALPNYRARGFRPYKEEVHWVDVP